MHPRWRMTKTATIGCRKRHRGLADVRGFVLALWKSRATQKMRIIGSCDPGPLQVPRLGGDRGRIGPPLRHVANGLCRSEGRTWRSGCCRCIATLRAVSPRFPDAAAVEQTFVNRDGAGHAEAGPGAGHRDAGAGAGGLPVGEYAPNAVKKPWWAWAMPTSGRSSTWCGCNCPASNRPGPMPPTRWPSRSAMPFTRSGAQRGGARGAMIGQAAGRLDYAPPITC
jgi:hypothetical protein